MEKHGTLYIVSTPIGNLEDITLRALRILKESDYILCEDKRVSLKLLNKYKIKNKLITYQKFNEEKSLKNLIGLLKEGKTLSLISDAGTPAISDPGTRIIRQALLENISVYSIPGPSAISAVVASFGLKNNDFLFIGYLPEETLKRKKIIESLRERASSVIMFISPHDFKKYIGEVCSCFLEDYIFIAKELTKLYEGKWMGKGKDILSKIDLLKKIKGEFVVIVEFENKKIEVKEEDIIEEIKQCIKKGYSHNEASKLVSKEFNLSKSAVYKSYLKWNKINS